MKRLFIWNNKDMIHNGKIVISKMPNSKHDPNENCKALIWLLLDHFPGNALDIFMNIIESKVIELQALNPDMIQERYFITNHIKSALNEFIDKENDL